MADRRRIVLYGNSVVLGSVGASLERLRAFELVHLATPLPNQAELEALPPDVILFDSESGHADAAFALLETRSDLRLRHQPRRQCRTAVVRPPVLVSLRGGTRLTGATKTTGDGLAKGGATQGDSPAERQPGPLPT